MSDYQFLKLLDEYNNKPYTNIPNTSFSLPQTILAIFDRDLITGFDGKISKRELVKVSQEEYESHIKDIKKYVKKQNKELGHIPSFEDLEKFASDGNISRNELQLFNFNVLDSDSLFGEHNYNELIDVEKLNKEELQIAEKRGLLKNIESRKKQFNTDDIINLIQLTDEEFQIAKEERNLFRVIEGRLTQLDGVDIANLAKSSDEQFKIANEDIMYSHIDYTFTPDNNFVISLKDDTGTLFEAKAIDKNGNLVNEYGMKESDIDYHYDYFNTKTNEHMINKIENGAIKQEVFVDSPLGTTTKRNAQYEKNGSYKTELLIKDKDGNNILNRKVNHQVNGDNAITIIENNGKINEYKVEGLNSDVLNITTSDNEQITLDLVELCNVENKEQREQMLKTIKKLPVNTLIELKNETGKIDYALDPGYLSSNDNICFSEVSRIDTILHELGHAQDYMYFKDKNEFSLSSSETFNNVFKKELKMFSQYACKSEKTIIKYLTTYKYEMFADAKMLLNTNELLANQQRNLTGRQLLLLKYFPETMAVVQEISIDPNRFEGKEQRIPTEKL